ncbi:MAG TPA: Uma2 family endonuclease [Blastocatellia bacterium]|nr:Uma2 family endonuclease [Blastocatellia bacterium]
MTTYARSYLDVIAHMPAGGRLILYDVSWEEYEQLLDELGDRALRVSYFQGRLEIMSPSLPHERPKEFLLQLACAVADEFDLTLETAGSTTFKDEQLQMGAEPDTCFYIENAEQIIGKEEINLMTDPPPDVVVEIDIWSESVGKMEFYAAIGVPEFWRYRKGRLYIYHLSDDGYVEAEASRAFPLLTAEVLTRFLEQNKRDGQSATLRAFREWLRAAR